MRTPYSHTFLAFILKFLNFWQAFVGVVIILYSVYVLNQWNHHHDPITPPNESRIRPHDALRFNIPSIPAPWFTYAFMGVGILVCSIAFMGCIAAELISGCFLCFYSVLNTIFILLEVGLVAFIALDHHWEKDIPYDPTGELDSLRTFFEENIDIFLWIGISLLIIQVLSLLLAIVLKSLVSSQTVDDDVEGDYRFNSSTREPLITPYSGSGSARGDSDIWSSRMREKYGLTSGVQNPPGDAKQ